MVKLRHPVATPLKRCEKYAKALGVAEIDLHATGTRANNELVKLLLCECGKTLCRDAVARHGVCHGNVMSVGVFEGRKDCGEELDALRACVAALPRR